MLTAILFLAGGKSTQAPVVPVHCQPKHKRDNNLPFVNVDFSCMLPFSAHREKHIWSYVSLSPGIDYILFQCLVHTFNPAFEKIPTRFGNSCDIVKSVDNWDWCRMEISPIILDTHY